MRLIHVRARSEDDIECLARALAVYVPTRVRRSLLIELEDRSTSDLLALLTAIETCVLANDIPSVGVELDGQQYALAPGYSSTASSS